VLANTLYKKFVGVQTTQLPTGWMVRGSNPGWGEIFRTCPDRPWGQPSLLYNGYRVFPGGKVRPGRDADPSPPSSAEVKNRVELYLYSLRAFVACKRVKPTYKRHIAVMYSMMLVW